MASYADLLDVQFIDASAHATTSTGDILGVMMPYFTGPSGAKHVFDRATFYENYPESLPGGVNISDFPNEYFDAYAQVKKYFDNGGKQVEVYVPDEHLNYICVPDYLSHISGQTSTGGGTLTDCSWMIAWKTPGLPSASVLPSGARTIRISVKETEVTLQTTTDTEVTASSKWTTVESFSGQFKDENAQIEGQYTHFKHVLNQSLFLQCVSYNDPKIGVKLSSTWGVDGTGEIDGNKICTLNIAGNLQPKVIGNNESSTTEPNTQLIGNASSGAMYDTSVYAQMYYKQFSDLDTTQCTMLIEAPANADIKTQIVEACKTRKNCTAWSSAATATHDSAINNFDYGEQIETTNPDKFHITVAGTETLSLFGSNYYLNCVGGVAGAYANIASEVRRNQVASARTYGSYVGTLLFTADFDQVLDLHKHGVVTVFTSSKGPQIFGIHNTLYSLQPNSYFAGTNVSRVLAALLYDIQPILLDSIHTDSAANPISRAVLVTKCNNIVNDHIGWQNLQPDSAFYATDAMNTDALTKGGKRLNCILKCHFIGLVETISLKVVATDSSVSVDVLSL